MNIENALKVLIADSPDKSVCGETSQQVLLKIKQLESQVEASKAAILYMLDRIKRDDQVQFCCGYGTETCALLIRAAALLLGQSEDQVEEYIFGNPDNRQSN